MSANDTSSSDVDEYDIQANDDLVRSVIVDQTDNLEKGWREAAQNAIDSDATVFQLFFNSDSSYMFDNGSGVELNEQKGIDLLRVMGNSSKESDNHENIGEFGIGKGQIIAKGKTVFMSGDTALLFDIKNWGLTARAVPLTSLYEHLSDEDTAWKEEVEGHCGPFLGEDEYEGLGIVVNHYEDEVPDEDSFKWGQFKDDFTERFQYLSLVDQTEIKLSGEVISNEDPFDLEAYGSPAHKKKFTSEETGDVYISVKEGHSTLTVYSGGIKVTNVDGRGLGGSIVVDRNLQLNFARNEIKSGCPIWSELTEKLKEIRDKLYGNGITSLNRDARQYVAERMLKDEEVEKHQDTEVFKVCNESYVSFTKILSQEEIGVSRTGNHAADALAEMGYVVLDEEDPACKTYLEERDDLVYSPEMFDGTERAEKEGLMTTYETWKENDLTPTQTKKLGVARFMADLMGWEGEINWGESDVAHAWTNGEDEITFTDSCAESMKWICWVPQLHQTLVHEICHREPDKEQANHGGIFNRTFREKMEEGGVDVLEKTQDRIQDDSLESVAVIGNSDT
jgi:hypothetical protein